MIRRGLNIFNRWLNQRGLGLTHFTNTSLGAAMARLRAREVVINTIIDVGASDGRWSQQVLHYFPDAFYLLLDANAVHRDDLERFTHQHPRSAYHIGVIGRQPGETYFDARDPFGGAAYELPSDELITLPMTTIDAEVAARQLPPPYLIKTDTHGFEIPILEGASATLAQTAIVIMEVYNFSIAPTALRFPQLCVEMETRGFRPVDLIDPMHRPHDGALWQFDMVFARADAPVFAHNHYA